MRTIASAASNSTSPSATDPTERSRARDRAVVRTGPRRRGLPRRHPPSCRSTRSRRSSATSDRSCGAWRRASLTLGTPCCSMRADTGEHGASHHAVNARSGAASPTGGGRPPCAAPESGSRERHPDERADRAAGPRPRRTPRRDCRAGGAPTAGVLILRLARRRPALLVSLAAAAASSRRVCLMAAVHRDRSPNW